MNYIERSVAKAICQTLTRGKSILLLGPRQTGKTTIIKQLDSIDIALDFALTSTRIRYETEPSLLINEIEGHGKNFPLVFIDEVQKFPDILDNVQYLIDNKKAQFILTGSSVRKLRRSKDLNLLPGRVVLHYLDPLYIDEYQTLKPTIEELLFYGSLPEIMLLDNAQYKEVDLKTYAATYLDEEIRAEAAVRNLANFARFLTLAAIESGNIVNFSSLSQDIGVSHTTISDYYQILEDCMIAKRIEPYSKKTTRRNLTKTPKYLLFDLGVRRVSAKEGTELSETRKGQLFEQFVGLEILRYINAHSLLATLSFWRSRAGPEIDWLIDYENHLIPVEVKWTTIPKAKDCKHLSLFLSEYSAATTGYIICRTPRRFKLKTNIIVLPWQELAAVFQRGEHETTR